MNIAFLCSSASWGGLEMNVWRLAHYMQLRGHNVVSIGKADTPFFSYSQRVGILTVPLEIRNHYTDIKAARKLARFLKENDFQIILFSVAKDNYTAGWAKYFFFPRLHLIYMQQMMLGIPKKGLIQTLMYRALSAWITPLNSLAEQVKQKTFMPVERIHVIPLGVDTQQFKTTAALKKEARQVWGLPEDAFIVGVIGRLDPGKCQDILIQALAILNQKEIAIHGLIVGEETIGDTRNYPSYLLALTNQLNIQHLIHFRPFTDDTKLAFAALDVFAMASSGETYGMVTIEAMAAGLPVIGTNTGGTVEILNQGKVGLLIPPKNAQALADAIEILYKDSLLRDTLSKVACEAAVMRFDYRLQCEQCERLFNELIA